MVVVVFSEVVMVGRTFADENRRRSKPPEDADGTTRMGSPSVRITQGYHETDERSRQVYKFKKGKLKKVR